MKRFYLFTSALFLFIAANAQKITAEEYIRLHKDFAIREMKRMGVPAAITLAQGLLETENGNSDLVRKSNNHFGIKCKTSWTAGGVSHDDDTQGECFRTYKNFEESYRDHSNYLRGNERYGFLFKLDPSDYQGWAHGLKNAGYATNPHYPDILIKHIETYNLQQYTSEGYSAVPVFNSGKYKDDPEDKAFNDLIKSKEYNNPINYAAYNQTLIINGSKAMYASKGKSLLAIATENKINLAKLLEYNDLEKDGLLVQEQYIFFEKKSKQGDKDFYIVQKNENLYDVAQKNGSRLQSLYEYNNLTGSESIFAGSKLILKPLVKDEPLLVRNAPEKELIKTHEVQPKEGLYAISKKYGISVTQLKEWNNLSDDNLKIGQQLIISK